MYPKIAIIGAGPSGLSLARLLKLQGITTTLFESEPNRSYRPQGGTLDLHIETGQLVLRECGLWEQAKKHLRYDGQDMIITTKNLNHVFEERNSGENSDGNRPEMDRTALREMLIDSIGNENIRWGTSVDRIEMVRKDNDDSTSANTKTSSNTWNVIINNGHVEGPFDLVVGCDGAWSKVRGHLTDKVPQYTGVTGLEVHHSNPKSTPELDALVGRGSIFACSDGKGLTAQRMSDGSIRLYINSRQANPDYFKNYSLPLDRPKLLELYSDWKPELLDLIKLCDDQCRPWPYYAIDEDSSFEHVSGLTLCGDAAHLISPFAGEGVNLAMRDALDLSRAISVALKNGKLDVEVTKFEKIMFERAAVTAADTDRNLNMFFDYEFPKTAKKMLEMMMQGDGADPGVNEEIRKARTQPESN